MRLNFILLAVVLAGVAGDNSIAGDGHPDVLAPEFVIGSHGSEQCIQAMWCNNTNDNCEEECTNSAFRVGECTFVSFLHPSGDKFWANFTACDSDTFSVQFWLDEDCTDPGNGFNLNVGECTVFSDGPNLRVTSCLNCLSTGTGVGATVGVILGIIALLLACCGLQYTVYR